MAGTPQQSAIVELLAALKLEGAIAIIDYFPTAFGTQLTTAGGSDNIVIDSDAAFVLYYMNGNVSQPAGTNIPAPDILVDVKNQGSGRYFNKNPMHWNTVIGNAQNPFFVPEPMFLPASSNVQITLTNLSGGSYARVDITWVGVKVRGLNGYDVNNIMGPMDFAYQR